MKSNMDNEKIHSIAQRLSDWKVIVAVFIVVVSAIFNCVSAAFNFALITKLAPINTKVSAIESANKDRDKTIDDIKTTGDRQYGGLVDKIDGVSNKVDQLTLRLIGKKFD